MNIFIASLILIVTKMLWKPSDFRTEAAPYVAPRPMRTKASPRTKAGNFATLS